MKFGKLFLFSILLLFLISFGAVSAASDNVTVDDFQVNDGLKNNDFLLSSNNGMNIDINSKLCSISENDLLLDGEGQNNGSKNYTDITVDKLTIEEDGASVYNCTIGTLTVNSENVTVFDNKLSKLILNGANGKAYDNTITGALTLKGNHVVASDNVITGDASLTGFNVTFNHNEIEGNVVVKGGINKLHNNTVVGGNVELIGANATVEGNDIIYVFSPDTYMVVDTAFITGVGNGAEIYNNTVSGISLTGKKVIVHDNSIIAGGSPNVFDLTGNNAIVYNNYVYGGFFLTGDNSIAYNNTIDNRITITLVLTGNNIAFYQNHIPNQCDMEVGVEDTTKSARIYDNNCSKVSVYLYSKGAIVYNNTFSNVYGYSDNSEIYDNDMQKITINGVNVRFHDNYAHHLSLFGKNAIICNNHFNHGTFSQISGDNSYFCNNTFKHKVRISKGQYTIAQQMIESPLNNVTFINNTLHSTDKYAVEIGELATNVVVKCNRLYAEGNVVGDAAVLSKGENIVEDNYPLTNTLIISADNITVDQMLRIEASLDEYPPSGSTIKFIVNSKTYESVVYNKKSFWFGNLPVGEYAIVVISDEYGDYAQAMNSTVVKVSKLTPNLNLNVSHMEIGRNAIVSASVIGATGDVTFIVDGVENNVELVEGVANYKINNIAAGNHSIVAIYNGDDKNEAAFNSTTFTLEKTTPDINIAVDDLKLAKDATVTVTIANATGKVNITVDGVENIVDLTDGVATYIIQKITAGTHTVVAMYGGDDKFNEVSASISKTLIVLATEITDINVDGDLNINAALKDSQGKGIENATILYKIGAQNATVLTGTNGTFTIKGEENAKVEIYFAGDDNLFPTSTVISLSDFAPTKIGSVISASKFTCYAVDTSAGEKGSIYKVVLKDASDNLIANARIQFVLDGVIYVSVTDDKGIASVQVNINKANNYVCTIIYLGDNKHESTFTTSNITVMKKKTTLTAKATTFKVKAKTKKYTATLKTIKGSSTDGKTYLGTNKKVTLKVNGKTYTAKTNKKGQITFKITKLNKKGKYNAVIKFAGDNTYKGVTKKVKITVK